MIKNKYKKPKEKFEISVIHVFTACILAISLFAFMSDTHAAEIKTNSKSSFVYSLNSCIKDLNKDGHTIVLTTHYLEEAESLCRNIAIIDHGQIVKNTSIRELLKQLNKETFVLDTREELAGCPVVEGYPLTLIDSNSMEVAIEKSQSVNGLFTALTEQGIHILSMRNKTNRLEELFFDLVEKNLQEKKNG